MRRLLPLLLLLLLLPVSARGGKWTPETLPMVHLQDARRYLCNPDGVIGAAAADSIDHLLYALQHDKGVQTVAVAVKQLEGDDPYTFGMQLARKYGIGSKTQNSGLIIILATEDRSYQILTGRGMEATLPDAVCRRIENRVMLPLLKQHDWDAAMLQTLESIDLYVRGDETLRAEMAGQSEAEEQWAGLLIAAVVVVFFVVFGILKSRARRCPRCGQATMVKVSERRVQKDGAVYLLKTYRCPKCGHTHRKLVREDTASDLLMMTPFLFGRGGGGGGGSFGGGSFGGGSFGGGGSGGRF